MGTEVTAGQLLRCKDVTATRCPCGRLCTANADLYHVCIPPLDHDGFCAACAIQWSMHTLFEIIQYRQKY